MKCPFDKVRINLSSPARQQYDNKKSNQINDVENQYGFLKKFEEDSQNLLFFHFFKINILANRPALLCLMF